MNEYRHQKKEVLALKSWVTSTVARHYVHLCCDEDETLRTWYAQLMERVKPADIGKIETVLEEYEKAVRVLTRPLRDIQQWLKDWSAAISKAQKHNIERATVPWMWWRDFKAAIIRVNPTWAGLYHGLYKQSLRDGTLTIRTVAADFEEEITKNSTANRARVAKGAFGPTYHGEGADEKEEEVRPTYKSRGKRKRFQPARAQSSRTRDEPERKCLVCERTTCPALELCYYAFPDQAPKRWVPWAHVQEVADINLEKPYIKKKVAEITKNKRQKVTHTTTSDDGKQ